MNLFIFYNDFSLTVRVVVRVVTLYSVFLRNCTDLESFHLLKNDFGLTVRVVVGVVTLHSVFLRNCTDLETLSVSSPQRPPPPASVGTHCNTSRQLQSAACILGGHASLPAAELSAIPPRSLPKPPFFSQSSVECWSGYASLWLGL